MALEIDENGYRRKRIGKVTTNQSRHSPRTDSEKMTLVNRIDSMIDSGKSAEKAANDVGVSLCSYYNWRKSFFPNRVYEDRRSRSYSSTNNSVIEETPILDTAQVQQIRSPEIGESKKSSKPAISLEESLAVGISAGLTQLVEEANVKSIKVNTTKGKYSVELHNLTQLLLVLRLLADNDQS